MLSYLTHKEIDFTLWDDCLNSASNGVIYGLSWYLDIVSPGWEAIVKVQNWKYVAIMPVPVFYKFGIPYVRQPLFAQQLGVFSRNPITDSDWYEIGQILQKRFRMISRYEFNTENHLIGINCFKDFKCQLFTTYYLHLEQGYDKIVSGYQKGRRWRVNKAKRGDLVIKPSTDIDLIISIFKEYIAPKIAGIIGEAYEYKMLRQLYKEASKRGMAFMYAAVDREDKAQAMGLFFYFNNRIIYIFNSSTPEGKRKSGIPLLIDYVLHEFAGQKITFDFESPEVEDVAEFYSSFGSEKANFLSISANRLPAPIRLIKKLRMNFYRLIK